MNRYQKIVLGGAFANAVVLMLFPPFDVETLARAAPVFDAFYPVFSAPPNRTINGNLLYLALFAVVGNAGLAWLALLGGREGLPRITPRNLVMVLGFLNLLAGFLFPPYEAVPLAGRLGGGSFDGFGFALAESARRRIFVPLLYIEVLYVLINACAFWLALGERSARSAIDASIEELISEKEATEAEIEARIKRGVEERIAEEAKAAGRAAAQRNKT
jgi:hypothetical protein